jgi:hypothetical protein
MSPLKTPEEKKDALKWILSQIKIYAVAVAAAGASVWGIAEYYLEDYVRSTATKVIEEKQGNKSFREILGEQLNLPTDMVPYYLSEKCIQLDSLTADIGKFQEVYMPYLEFQLSISPTYFYWKDGIEFWMGPDGYGHGVMYDDKGKWCVYHSQRRDL